MSLPDLLQHPSADPVSLYLTSLPSPASCWADIDLDAATLLLIAGVSPRMAMDLMGWSTPAMAQRYQHPVDALRADASQRVSAIVFGA